MSKKLITESLLTNIANAIRAKNGTSASMTPAEMATAITAIPTGGSTPTGTKQISITANGTTIEDVSAYANAEIMVNVPSGGTNPTFHAEFSNTSETWITPVIENPLANNREIELVIYDPTPSTDYGNIMSIGLTSTAMTQWVTNSAIHIYHNHDSNTDTHSLGFRYNGSTTYGSYPDITKPITVKITPTDISVDGTTVMTTPSTFVSAAGFFIGSKQGTKRYSGTLEITMEA